ncbi:hypothetical protein LL947_10720 [Halomonas sp. BLK-85]
MSLRDVLQQRRLRASVPAVPAAPPPTGTEKNHLKQWCSQRSRCSRSDVIGAKQKTVSNNTPLATADEVETMLANLRAVGRDLGEVEALAHAALLKLTRAAAAELVAVLDDLHETAPGADVARSQCQRVLNDPRALEAAKALWPDLATLPVEQPDTPALVIEHPATWYDFIKQQCPLTREDELYLLRCLSSLATGDAMQAARRYVSAWHQAADAEPTPHRKDNAGRRAANRSLWENQHAK